MEDKEPWLKDDWLKNIPEVNRKSIEVGTLKKRTKARKTLYKLYQLGAFEIH